MTIPSVIEAATGVSSEVAQNAVTADPGQQIIAKVVEPATPAPAADPKAMADAIERARAQEKEKLYGRLNERDERLAAMEAELSTLRAEREAKDAAEAAQKAALDEAARLKTIAETSAKDLVLQQQQEWEAKFAALQADREREREALAKEVEFNGLRAYVQEQILAHKDDVAPQFFDLINGNTREEIDASVAVMQAKTTEIVSQFQDAQTQQRSQMRGVSPTSIPGSAVDENASGTRNLSVQDIKNMNMSDWAKYRGQILGSSANNNKNRGLFD